MRDLHITVSNKVATYHARDGSIVCGNSDYTIVFTFDDEWESYSQKVARFIWGEKFIDVIFSGDKVTVPVLTNTSLLKVGIYAGEIATTTPAQIPCTLSVICESGGAEEADFEQVNGKIEYRLPIVTQADNGKILKVVNGRWTAANLNPVPIEVASESEMTSLLASAEIGSIYKYVGASGTYESGALYVVEAE